MKQTIEIFAGTKSFSKVAKERGYKTLTIDNEESLNPDVVTDILNYDPGEAWFMWFSPPCTGFSVASIGRHWEKDTREPKTDTARLGIKLLERTAFLIAKNKPKYWCIENPRGMFRKIAPQILRKHGLTEWRRTTVSYCQYGDKRMKPTDIFTNILNWEGKCCKNGNPCHEPAPRGSKAETQGIKNAKLRGVIPPALFEEIFEIIENGN